MEFYKTDIREQEITIVVDFFERTFVVYANRYQSYKRILKIAGEPNEKFYVKGQLCGGTWRISFSQRHIITRILSCPVLIGNMR